MADPIEIELKLITKRFDQVGHALDFFIHAGNQGLTHRALIPYGGDIPGQKSVPPTYTVAVTGTVKEIDKLLESWNEVSNPRY